MILALNNWRTFTALVKLYRGDKAYFATVLQKRLRLTMAELVTYRAAIKQEIGQVQKTAADITTLSTGIAFDKAPDTKAHKQSIKALGQVPEELEASLQNLLEEFNEQEKLLAIWETMLTDKQNAHNALNNQWLLLHNLEHR